MKIVKYFAAAVLLPLLCGCLCSGKSENAQEKNNMLKIGWGKRSIAMDGNVYIAGQMYTRIAQEAYTPVLANALVLEKKGNAVIFVSLDMVSISVELTRELREYIAREYKDIPAEKIILNATHTHAGPSDRVLGDFPHPFQIKHGQEVRDFLIKQISAAVSEAWSKRAPGSIAYGYGFATTGHSRRVVYLDDVGKRIGHQPGFAVNGHAKMYGNTNDDMFDGYEAGTDSFINLLYTFDENEKLTGAVINVPCPSQTNEGAWSLHASFWHNVREKLTAKYGDIGILGQAAAAGDLAPRQMHYHEAEKRRYELKYADKIKAYYAKPLKLAVDPGDTPERRTSRMKEMMEMMRAEDIANRIVAAFDEVLSWAGQDKNADPVLIHEIKKVDLASRLFPKEAYEDEKKTYASFAARTYLDPKSGKDDAGRFEVLTQNSRLHTLTKRSKGVIDRYEKQTVSDMRPATIHAVRIGDIAFATNRFELYMDFMHRIQARSPFVQTFIVQLCGDELGAGSYLATERAVKNKGYSASPYCNVVSPEGGQQLVNYTLDMLKGMKK